MAEIIAGTYEVIQKIGSGGGGNVYLAQHLRLNKKVVLKADKRRVTTRPELLRREVDVLKNLHHPYIPQVYDYFVEGDIVYTVMDYIEGESLDKPLERGERYTQAQVIKWGRQLLQALAYLHSPTHGDPPRGYTHSDIKPANLMRTPSGDICLIDFNIALALGEVNVIGRSAGYASPEHYGLDFSSNPGAAGGLPQQRTTPILRRRTTRGTAAAGRPGPGGTTTSGVHVIVPDVRSDIYSVGATLYHLLSGHYPAVNALQVVPLSEREFSPQIVAIITRAMSPNPDLRYQTADEMLYALDHLWDNDPRVRRLKRARNIACGVCGGLIVLGTAFSFTGLKRMQTLENWLRLSQDSAAALAAGDREQAIALALQALPAGGGPLTPPLTARAQRAAANALGVYDLSDGFRPRAAVDLPAEPAYVTLAPDGSTAACLCSGTLVIADTVSGEVLTTLPADPSALSEAEYLDNDTLLFAGAGGLQAYSISLKATRWSAQPATAIAVSADGTRIAAVFRGEGSAALYSADGQPVGTVDFGGRAQPTGTNDAYVDPHDAIFALNADGTLLAASFADGSLELFDLTGRDDGAILFEAGSGYSHFEGGFCGHYFAFSATNASQSVFAAVDTDTMVQTGGFNGDTPYSVQTDENGVYLRSQNILVRIDPENGDQTPLVTTPQSVQAFAHDGAHTLIANTGGFEFYSADAERISQTGSQYIERFLCLKNGVAVVANREEPHLRVLRYESHPEAEVLGYDPAYPHDEARISADGQRVMLFRYDHFGIFDRDGNLIAEQDIPDAAQVYDQQFRREGSGSWLEVTWYDGTVRNYNALDGTLLSTKNIAPPDASLYEEFEAGGLRVERPLHGTPTVYDSKSGKVVATLDEDAYLTYFNAAGPWLVAQYTTTDGYRYGQLLNERCEVVADLPYLCDVSGETLYFDYPTGNMRQTRIYDINTLRAISQNTLNGGMTK